MDGFLRLTHGFCLERSSTAQAGPTGTCVYTASQARLGGPIFTPRCFPKKTSCRGPSPKVHHTESHTYCLMFLLSCCMLQQHTCYNNTERQGRTLWQTHGMAFMGNIKVIFFPPLTWLVSVCEQIFSVSYLGVTHCRGIWCLSVCYLVERAWKIGILEASKSSDSFTAGMNQHDPLRLFRSVRP